jgi:hypothetical protein
MRKFGIAVAGAAVALGVWSAGSYHFVHGSNVSGVQVVPKPSFSLSETLINMDAVGNMPMIAARSQYPMFIAEMTSRSANGASVDRGPCGRIYSGMMYSQVELICGAPTSVGHSSNGAQTYYFASGVVATVENNLITSVRK